MNIRSAKPLFSRIPPGKLVGRDVDLERLYLRAVSSSESRPLAVVGNAGVGTSELLRNVFDRLFFDQRFVVPFYFALRATDNDAYSAAVRFKYQFLLQAVAFRTQQPRLIASSRDVCELSKLALPQDSNWVEQLCEVCENNGPMNDARAFIRNALSSPSRAAEDGNFRVCIIIDDVHEASLFQDGNAFVDEMFAIAEAAKAQVLFGSRKMFDRAMHSIEKLEIAPLSRIEIGIIIEDQATELGTDLSEQVRDLLGTQFVGRPAMAIDFIRAARSNNKRLESYRDVAQLYANELVNGVFKSHFERLFAEATPSLAARQALIDILGQSVESGGDPFDLDTLRNKLTIGSDEIDRIVSRLQLAELLEKRSGQIQVASDSLLRSFLLANRRVSTRQQAPGAVSALAVTNALKRSPVMMSRVYRDEASIGLADILGSFDIQSVPLAMIDYERFRDAFKGMPDAEMRAAINSETEKLDLPQIAHVAPIAEHSPEFNADIEPNRAVIGVGFNDHGYRDEDEVAWFAAEIDSKLEADAALTREWCERLENAADQLGYVNRRIWLVAPEGFSEGALAILADHNGFGSSRRQAELLKEILKGTESEKSPDVEEYEIVIPIGSETELIAAHAFEDIARKYSYPAKAVNQIKTALVEACINASEHSLSPDRKIYQKFAVNAEKVTISISNRGIRLTDKIESVGEKDASSEGRRGWGLGLIRTLMDEVRIESVDDGTRIVMTKFIKATS